MPEVTIILLAYNSEATIGRALASIAAQTVIDRLRLVIVDDASSDGTLSVIADTLERYPDLEFRTSLIRHESNRGSAAAYMSALEAADTEWLARCDHDDTLPPDSLERLLRLAESSGADIVAGAIERHKGDSVKMLTPKLSGLNSMPLDTPSFSLCNKIYRRSLLLRAPDGAPILPVPGIDCWDDLSIMARLLAIPGVRTAVLPGAPVYHYILEPDTPSLTRSRSDVILAQHIHCAEFIDRWMKSNHLAATYAPFILRLKFIAKVKLLRGPGRWRNIRRWQSTFPETTPYIMSATVMGPDVSLPLRIAFKAASML